MQRRLWSAHEHARAINLHFMALGDPKYITQQDILTR